MPLRQISIHKKDDSALPTFIASFRFLWPCVVSKVWREKTNKMQQLDVYY